VRGHLEKAVKHHVDFLREPQRRPLVDSLKLKEAAKYLSLSPISVRRLIHRGLVKPNRALHHILISIAELDRLLKER